MSSLRSRTIRLASENPDLRPYLLPLLKKTAGITLHRENIEVKLGSGSTQSISAMVHGPWAIHKGVGSSGYSITFIPEGITFVRKLKSLANAEAILSGMLEEMPELQGVVSKADLTPYKARLIQIQKDPSVIAPSVPKTPTILLEEKRDAVIAALKADGLFSMGRRSGKAGEFFSVRGLPSAPTRAISVGSRDVLLNEYDVLDDKWKMNSANPFSLPSPPKTQEGQRHAFTAPARRSDR